MPSLHQTALIQAVPAQALHLFFEIKDAAQARECLSSLISPHAQRDRVVGLSDKVCSAVGIKPPAALRSFRPPPGSRVKLPVTQRDVWVWVRSGMQDLQGTAQADVLARSRQITAQLSAGFKLSQALPCFRHGLGRDLTGYEDGTENPKGKKAMAAAIAPDGSSFAALQQWEHQWQKIDSMTEQQRDHAIGRVRKSNEEIEDAPESAHVKRTAQEDFTLSDGSLGFSLRRSMPWSEGTRSGLMFTSFGKNWEAFEAQLAKMTGAVDGITDAVFRMSKPISGEYYWCPPADFKI
jgi:porphyrinogen peroxidase